MADWLCIQLAGPLASFGEQAGNVERGTADHPTRSALLGLAGAALGIRREDAPAQAALAASLSTSTRTLRPGETIVDFHTFEGVQQTRDRYATRAEALRLGGRNTSITRREYRCDGYWLAAYREKPGATISLTGLATAFRHPVFALWLGRKSCPLSLPLWPVCVAAPDVDTAFAAYIRNELADRHGHLPEGSRIATDAHTNLPQNGPLIRHARRMDEPLSRTGWTFRARDEFEFMTGADTPAPQGETDAKTA